MHPTHHLMLLWNAFFHKRSMGRSWWRVERSSRYYHSGGRVVLVLAVGRRGPAAVGRRRAARRAAAGVAARSTSRCYVTASPCQSYRNESEGGGGASSPTVGCTISHVTLKDMRLRCPTACRGREGRAAGLPVASPCNLRLVVACSRSRGGALRHTR